jgi:hypothetical protein
MPTYIWLLVFIFTMHKLHSKNPNLPNTVFGNVSLTDFSVPDSLQTHDAVVLADACNIYFEANKNGGFSMVRYRYKKVLLTSKKSFQEATITVLLQTANPHNEKLVQVKAASYHIQHNNIQRFEVSNRDRFTQRLHSQTIAETITIPNVIEGCIIEYAYTTKTDYLWHIPTWYFETQYPTVWSVYTINIPAFFTYHIFKKGNMPYFKQTKKRQKALYQIQDFGHNTLSKSTLMATNNNIQQWVMHNVKAITYEPYVHNITDYTNNIELVLVKYAFEDNYNTPIADSWETANNALMNAPMLGNLMNEDAWVKEISDNIIFKTDNTLDTIIQLHEYFKLNYECNNTIGMYANKNFKSLYFSRVGSAADLNLFFIAILRNAGIHANPVVLRKKSFGKPFRDAPLLYQFNYLVVRITIDSYTYYIDVSNKNLDFNELEEECYNEFAFLVGEKPAIITLPVKEANTPNEIYTNIHFNAKENVWQWHTTYTFEKGLGQHVFNNTVPLQSLLNFSNTYIADSTLTKTTTNTTNRFASMHGYSLPATGNVLTVLPFILSNGIQLHVIDTARRFPIELPYAVHNNYLIQINIPPNTTLHLPQPVSVDVPEMGSCYYNAVIIGNNIEIAATFQLKKINFMPDETTKVYKLLQVWHTIEQQVLSFTKAGN